MLENVKVYELVPANFQNQKSFYGKAKIWKVDDMEILNSYNTPVASITNDGKLHKHWDDWSSTTGRHICAFAGRKITKADWLNMEME